MREVVVYELLSLDGIAEDPDRFITDWDEAMDRNLGAVIGRQDAVILGRRSYEEWAGFWPTSAIEPFASFINSVTKYVVTSSPLSPAWRDSSAIRGDLVTSVEQLKHQPGGEIGVHASLSVTHSLLAAGLVDELKLVIAPKLAAAGDVCSTGCHPSS